MRQSKWGLEMWKGRNDVIGDQEKELTHSTLSSQSTPSRNPRPMLVNVTHSEQTQTGLAKVVDEHDLGFLPAGLVEHNRAGIG